MTMLVKEIDSRELSEWLASDTPPRLIDVRTPQEMMQASIAKGEPMPLTVLPLRINDIPQDDDVVIYCRTGNRSWQACMFLMQKGYKRIFNLKGGIVAWAQIGLPVEPMNLNETIQ
ncbi:Rhodanese-related sulfurtransferase [Beggiatoa alba B18LD]|uniref:Rhodanese-related sulfurtransferase n=1 Tax=Beggiatoa alba B18LD TaxID=395493 RepID=I3CG50_9GAMM|nr:rhodanese-like domain-containing protein [Beggiatoa alba]EIJ42593.1 Rhodanese-related sulfurtransferase [Beggiatoa alba B18LD]